MRERGPRSYGVEEPQRCEMIGNRNAGAKTSAWSTKNLGESAEQARRAAESFRELDEADRGHEETDRVAGEERRREPNPSARCPRGSV